MAVAGSGWSRRLTYSVHGVWRSLVAHSLWERGAVGSNPATPTTSNSRNKIEILAACSNRVATTSHRSSHSLLSSALRMASRSVCA